jgi:hypothetical protein
LLDSIIFSIRSPWIWLKWEPKDFYKYKSIAYNVTSNILLSIIQCKHQNRIKNNVGIIPKSNFKIIKLIQTKRKIQHFSDLRAHLRIYQTVGCFSSRLSLWINVRECRRGNQIWTIQRNWKHRVHICSCLIIGWEKPLLRQKSLLALYVFITIIIRGYHSSVVSKFIRYIYYWKLQLLNNEIIIIKAKVLLPLEYVTLVNVGLADVGYPVVIVLVSSS